MKVSFISIGDELLIGQTINTNAAWLGKEFSARGFQVQIGLNVADEKEEIIAALNHTIPNADVVVITGGLGPTKDDITKHTLVAYFQTELAINEEVLHRIKDFFERRNRPMLPVNVQQAALPVSAKVLHNYNGTASGMWFEKEGCIVISLPGVPYEMKGIMTDEVFPRLKDLFQFSSLYHETLMTLGIGESFLAEKLADWEDRIRDSGLGLAYLPSPGVVRLRITSKKGDSDAPMIRAFLLEAMERLPQFCYTLGEASIFEVIANLMKSKGFKLGTVESCTGGHIMSQLVQIPGSSAFFEGGIVAYSYAQKEQLLGISKEDLLHHGAVSEEIVRQMAEKGREMLGIDYCVATSGIAGPDGGTAEKPVGMVWIAVANKVSCTARVFQFGDNRERNIQTTALSAMGMLRRVLMHLD